MGVGLVVVVVVGYGCKSCLTFTHLQGRVVKLGFTLLKGS